MRRALLISFVALAACTGETALQSDPAPPEGQASLLIRGRVLDSAGLGVSYASVRADGALVGEADIHGRFEVAVPDSIGALQLEAVAEGYSTGHRRLENVAEGTELQFTLLPTQRLMLANAEAGGTLTGNDGVAIHFAPGFVDEAGAPVEGAIEVEWALMNTPESVAAAPGNMIAAAPGVEPFPLESFGMVEVRLTQGGRKVQIVEPAVLEIPLADHADFGEGDVAGLWGFDEESGRWYQEGEGAIVDRTFVATVPHFSVWNCDMPMETSCQKATFETPAGEPMVDIEVRLDGVDYNGAWWGRTGDDGSVCLLGRRGSKANLGAMGSYGSAGATYSFERQILTHAVTGDCLSSCVDLGVIVVTDTGDDFDADGFTELAGDCDDSDATRKPGALEVCDYLDNDCDGAQDEGHADVDHDAYTDCWDCDDTNPIVHPLAPDVCDGVLDADCDTFVDRREADADADGLSLCDGDCDDLDALSGGGCGWGSVSAGPDASCAVRTDGSVACWGWGAPNGAMATDIQLRRLSVGGDQACGLDAEGRLHCWSQFGAVEAPFGGYLSDLSLGPDHGCGVASTGTVVCWGEDSFAETAAPTGLYSAVSTSETHGCALSTLGAVACWGSNSDGQRIVPIGSYTQVSAGNGFSCAVRTDGKLRCWGRDDVGQSSPPAGTFRLVSAGDGFACGVRDGGALACWGDLSGGLELVPEVEFVALDAGSRHVCAVRADGETICWGSNSSNQCVLPN